MRISDWSSDVCSSDLANLGNLEMDRERPAQAVGYFEKAARDFESMGAVNELAGISGMLVTAQLQLLRPDAALAESGRAWALLPRIQIGRASGRERVCQYV